MKSILITAVICAAALCAVAQDTFSIPWSAITGGGAGASSEPGEFTIRGAAVGQFAASDSADGPPGEFSVTEGYWTFESEPSLPELNLTIQLQGGMINLTWDAGAPPVVLESSTDLQTWAPVDPQPAGPFFQEPAGAQRFYRLRSP